MKRDRVVEHNRRMWDRLAKAGIPYTRPLGRPPRSREGMRRFIDPRGRLRAVTLAGARVLALAAGGGWDPVVFAKLGAAVTLLDISTRQLRTVRELAKREGVRMRFVQGDMRDLSRFEAGSFDLVWHCHSLVFVRQAARVIREVARVLAPGGIYVLSTMHPTTLRLYGTYRDGGWRPRTSYFDDSAVPHYTVEDATWDFGETKVYAPTIEFGHTFETIINALSGADLVTEGLWEFSPNPPDPEAAPGSDDHLETLFPAFIEVRARKNKRP
ncbi:MAG: class I SAM-dependent methyltransferase [Chloroflexi bacterium]|nr:MAG: class I SAM-dependent methyltransferase [Chloroflexota bacterium]